MLSWLSCCPWLAVLCCAPACNHAAIKGMVIRCCHAGVKPSWSQQLARKMRHAIFFAAAQCVHARCDPVI